MSSTLQTQTLNNINTILSLAAQMASLYNTITAVNNAWNDNGSLSISQALHTAPFGSDGTLGTADVTPVNTNPIDTRVYTSLQRAISENDVTSMLTQLNNIVSFINGNALAATPGVRAIFNKASGG